jgi:hypothetical protein
MKYLQLNLNMFRNSETEDVPRLSVEAQVWLIANIGWISEDGDVLTSSAAVGR